MMGICLRTLKRWRKAFLGDGAGKAGTAKKGSARLVGHRLSEEEKRHRILLTFNEPEYGAPPALAAASATSRHSSSIPTKAMPCVEPGWNQRFRRWEYSDPSLSQGAQTTTPTQNSCSEGSSSGRPTPAVALPASTMPANGFLLLWICTTTGPVIVRIDDAFAAG